MAHKKKDVHNRMLNQWLTGFSLSAFITFIGFLTADTIEETIIFRPIKLPANYTFHFKHLKFTEHFIDTHDGGHINVLWFTADSTGKKSEVGAILYSHGNADNLVRWGALAHDFVPLGFDFIVWDYRTFGKSTGKLNQVSLLQDAQSVYYFAQSHYPEKLITVYGRSLGTGISAHLAKNNHPKQLILETPYSSLHYMAQHYIPVMPRQYNYKYTLPTEEYLQSVTCPVYIFHGTADEVVPYESGLRLKPLLKDSTHFITIEGGKHKNLNTFPLYYQKLNEILTPSVIYK